MLKLVLSFLFITLLNVLSFVAQEKDLYDIFTSNHFTVTIESNKEDKVYEFNKQDKVWVMEYSKRNKTHNGLLHVIRKKKVFWDNFNTLEKTLARKIYTYYNTHPYYEAPNNKDVCYKVTDGINYAFFNAEDFNIRKALNHVGWTNNRSGRHPDYRKQ